MKKGGTITGTELWCPQAVSDWLLIPGQALYFHRDPTLDIVRLADTEGGLCLFLSLGGFEVYLTSKWFNLPLQSDMITSFCNLLYSQSNQDEVVS